MKSKYIFLIFIFIITTFSFADTLTGLLANYEFSGNTYDSSSNSNHATNVGATLTTDRFGNLNSAYNFDGNDYIATPFYRQNYAYLTVSAWFNFTGSISGDTYSTIIGSTNGDFFVGKNRYDSNIGVQDQSNYYNPSMAVGTNAWNGEWHHVAYTYNNGLGTLYFDGAAYRSDNFSKGSAQITIGQEVAGNYFFKGVIDEVMLYDRVLSGSDVLELYSNVPEPLNIVLLGMSLFILGIIRKK